MLQPQSAPQWQHQRALSFIDKLIVSGDRALRALVPTAATASRPSPAQDLAEPQQPCSAQQNKHVAGLMRVNHTGEVCAQALYQGQALTAKLPTIRAEMEQAATEEIDHLVWCEQRLAQLDSHTSVLNPLFYAASFSLGALAGLAGDRWSLGFVAATEEQVCEHLQQHLTEIPDQDGQSRAVLEQMLLDEQAHASHALAAGGKVFPEPVKKVMTAVSKLMTASSYRL